MNRSQLALLCGLTAGIFLAACGGGGGGANSATPPVAGATPVGEPTGAPTTKQIGTNGGTLSTPQGELAITVPAGTLSGDIEFSATPITAKASGAVGGAWRLGPEGTTFSSSVSLTFKYTDAMVAGTTVEHLHIASQNADHTWTNATGQTVDATAKTITVQTSHFSDWVLVRDGSAARPGARRIVAKYSGDLTSYPITMTVEDSVSVVLPFPVPEGLWGYDSNGHVNPDGPIPDTIVVTNEATKLGAVNDDRPNCRAPELAGSPELITVTGIQVSPPSIAVIGTQSIPGYTVGASNGGGCIGNGTETFKPRAGATVMRLDLTSGQWDETGRKTVTYTDPYGWTWTIGPN